MPNASEMLRLAGLDRPEKSDAEIMLRMAGLSPRKPTPLAQEVKAYQQRLKQQTRTAAYRQAQATAPTFSRKAALKAGLSQAEIDYLVSEAKRPQPEPNISWKIPYPSELLANLQGGAMAALGTEVQPPRTRAGQVAQAAGGLGMFLATGGGPAWSSIATKAAPGLYRGIRPAYRALRGVSRPAANVAGQMLEQFAPGAAVSGGENILGQLLNRGRVNPLEALESAGLGGATATALTGPLLGLGWGAGKVTKSVSQALAERSYRIAERRGRQALPPIEPIPAKIPIAAAPKPVAPPKPTKKAVGKPSRARVQALVEAQKQGDEAALAEALEKNQELRRERHAQNVVTAQVNKLLTRKREPPGAATFGQRQAGYVYNMNQWQQLPANHPDRALWERRVQESLDGMRSDAEREAAMREWGNQQEELRQIAQRAQRATAQPGSPELIHVKAVFPPGKIKTVGKPTMGELGQAAQAARMAREQMPLPVAALKPKVAPRPPVVEKVGVSIKPTAERPPIPPASKENLAKWRAEKAARAQRLALAKVEEAKEIARVKAEQAKLTPETKAAGDKWVKLSDRADALEQGEGKIEPTDAMIDAARAREELAGAKYRALRERDLAARYAKPAPAPTPPAAPAAPVVKAEPSVGGELQPGNWSIDNSPHKYRVAGKMVNGYQWESVNRSGVKKTGVARKIEDARSRANLWSLGGRSLEPTPAVKTKPALPSEVPSVEERMAQKRVERLLAQGRTAEAEAAAAEGTVPVTVRGTGGGGMAAIPSSIGTVELPRRVRPQPTQTPPAPLAPMTGTQAVREGLGHLAQTVKDAGDDILKVFSPASRGKEAAQTSFIIRHRAAELAQANERAQAATNKARRFFEKQDPQANYDFHDRMERGQPQPDGRLQGTAKVLRTLLDNARTEVQGLGTGKLEKFYVDYMPHIYKDPVKAEQIIRGQIMGRRPLQGPKSFLKHRTFEYLSDARAAGLEPLSSNPVDMVLLKVYEMRRYVMGQRVLADMKALGLEKFGNLRREGIPEDWVQIKDPVGTVYGPPEVGIKEAYDKEVMESLQATLDRLGVTHIRKPKIRGTRWGYAEGGEKITTKTAGPETVVEHELGHTLDVRYGLLNILSGGERLTGQGVVAKELRALADLRYEGKEVGPSFKKYVRKGEEKVANSLHALIYAPDKMKVVAPTVKSKLTAFLRSHPELKPLLDVKPSLVLGVRGDKLGLAGPVLIGHRFAPEPAARILNNFLSPGLRRKPTFEMWRYSGNMLNQAQLGMSAFHLMFTSIDAATSKVALGIEQLVAGKPAQAVSSFLLAPGAPVENILRGAKLRRVYYHPEGATPEMKQLLDAFIRGGGRAKMSGFYLTNAPEAFRKSVVQATQEFRAGRIGGGLYRTTEAALQLIPASIQTMARPIMQTIVPLQKMGVASDLLRFELERLGPQATQKQLSAVTARVIDSVDNRMGQLEYDNLFWDRTVKDLGMVAVRSLGWNLGTFRELGGGIVDIGRLPGRLKAGEPWMTHRTAYIIALPITVGTMGAIYQYLRTGKGPQELKDYFFPRTGKTLPNGQPERVAFASYMKDIYSYGKHPVTTVSHKLHPMLSSSSEMLSNENFYGTKIRNEDDPAVKQAADIIRYMGKQPIPFSVRQYQQLRESGESRAKAVQGFFGIVPAPASIIRTKAEEMMSQYLRENLPRGARTQEQADKSKRMSTMIQDVRQGKSVSLAGLSDADILKIRRESQQEPAEVRFKRLRYDQALKVWDAANPQERKLFGPLLQDKIYRAFTNGDLTEKQAKSALSSIGLGRR